MKALSILRAAGWKHNLAGISALFGWAVCLLIWGVMFK